VQHNIILVCDHKTASSLGTEFYKRIKPNHQYTAYVLLVREVLGLPVENFMVNGLQVAKTKAECVRQVTYRDEADFADLIQVVACTVRDYLQCKEMGFWPQSAPNPCSNFGGCTFHSICETATPLREQVIKSLYQHKEPQHGLIEQPV
jgi:hypothetical protein